HRLIIIVAFLLVPLVPAQSADLGRISKKPRPATCCDDGQYCKTNCVEKTPGQWTCEKEIYLPRRVVPIFELLLGGTELRGREMSVTRTRTPGVCSEYCA